MRTNKNFQVDGFSFIYGAYFCVAFVYKLWVLLFLLLFLLLLLLFAFFAGVLTRQLFGIVIQQDIEFHYLFG
jgi:hypothetical protein